MTIAGTDIVFCIRSTRWMRPPLISVPVKQVNEEPVATKVPLVTLKHPGSSKEKPVVAQEAVVTERNSFEIQAESNPNDSLEKLRLVTEIENNTSKYDNLEKCRGQI